MCKKQYGALTTDHNAYNVAEQVYMKKETEQTETLKKS
jgi:hypothetical protein